MNKPPLANETMGGEQTPPRLEDLSRAIARMLDRFASSRVWIQWNFITTLHSARAVTQVHGECIGRIGKSRLAAGVAAQYWISVSFASANPVVLPFHRQLFLGLVRFFFLHFICHQREWLESLNESPIGDTDAFCSTFRQIKSPNALIRNLVTSRHGDDRFRITEKYGDQ